MRVAFLGTGLMGAPMAARLIAAGYDVHLWNRSPQKMQPLLAAGATAHATQAGAVAGAEFVFVCLTDTAAVQEVLFEHAAPSMNASSIVIDLSTIGVAATRDFARRLHEVCGAAWLDCPVSGGVAGARAGSLIVLAGGDEGVLERATPLLRHLAARVTRMGDVGAGQAAKLCNQLIVATNMVAIAEAIAVGRALNVDVARLPAALQGGFADSKPLQIFGPRMAAPSDPGPAVSELRTMHKDILTILGAAADVKLSLPLLREADSLYRQVVAAGLGTQDLPILMHLYRQTTP
jgi:3-hydroxyisobutyrate dehydrogenase-like beta-hydroxyacid dehydrogenase